MPEWLSCLQHHACGRDGHGFKPQTSINAHRPVYRYMDQKDSAAMLTSIQSAGVTLEVNLRIRQARKHARDPFWLWMPRADVTRSPKQGYQWSHEKDLCPAKIFLKKRDPIKGNWIYPEERSFLVKAQERLTVACQEMTLLGKSTSTLVDTLIAFI